MQNKDSSNEVHDKSSSVFLKKTESLLARDVNILYDENKQEKPFLLFYSPGQKNGIARDLFFTRVTFLGISLVIRRNIKKETFIDLFNQLSVPVVTSCMNAYALVDEECLKLREEVDTLKQSHELAINVHRLKEEENFCMVQGLGATCNTYKDTIDKLIEDKKRRDDKIELLHADNEELKKINLELRVQYAEATERANRELKQSDEKNAVPGDITVSEIGLKDATENLEIEFIPDDKDIKPIKIVLSKQKLPKWGKEIVGSDKAKNSVADKKKKTKSKMKSKRRTKK